MKVVKNHTGDSCYLACLESFLADNGENVTQQKMINEGRGKNLCSDKGVINSWCSGQRTFIERDLCKQWNVKCEDVDINPDEIFKYTD